MKLALRLTLTAAALAFLAAPMLTLAAAHNFPYFGPLLSCTGDLSSVGINPTGQVTQTCHSFCDILATAQNILYFVITIAVFVIAPIMLAWGGVLWLTSGGSLERIAAGKKTLTATVIGLAIILGAFLIVNTFFYLVGQFPGSNVKNLHWSNIECNISAPTP